MKTFLQYLVSFIISLTFNALVLFFVLPWAKCDCVENRLNQIILLVGVPLSASFTVGLIYILHKKMTFPSSFIRSFAASFLLIVFLSFIVLKNASNLEKIFPSLTPQTIIRIPKIIYEEATSTMNIPSKATGQ